MQTLVCDMEADGLSPTIAWCLVAQELETGKEWRFGGPDGLLPEREEIKGLFRGADTIIFHNGCKYDAPALENLGIVGRDVYRSKLVDTLVWSQLFWPDRPWGHSVEKWAKHLGCEQKVEHEDWSQFSEAMMERCASDVRIQIQVYEELLKEKGSWDWSLASRIEHAAAEAAFEQEKTGCEFRIERAREYLDHLEKEMNDRQERLESLLGHWVYSRGEVKSPFKKDGNKTVNCYNWIGDADVGGPFTKVHFERISLRQNEKVALRLMELGWGPTEYTAPTEKNPKGLPKLRPNKEVCPNLEKMDNEAGKVLSEYSKISHRYGQIKGWVQNYEFRGDGRVSAAITGMANTGRRKHAIVVNVPKAEDEVFFGKEMRSLFTHRDGYKLVGWDADSMQLRIGAHYSDDQGFVKALTEGDKEKGTDAHSLIMKDASLDTRADGKKSVYCVPETAQALTKRGWKGPDELEIGELVLAYDPERNVKTWTPLEDVHRFDETDVYSLSHNHNFYVECTEDHKWAVWQRREGKKGLRDLHKQLRPFNELNSESNIVVNAPIDERQDREPSNNVLDTEKYNTDWVSRVINMSHQERLAFLEGFLVADGSFRRGRWNWNQLSGELADAALTCSYLVTEGFVHSGKVKNKDMISVNLNLKQHITGSRLKKDYVGKKRVWCPQTKYGTWVMRQNDVIVITGNTGLFGGSENKFKQELGDKGKGARDAVHARFPGVLSMKPAVEKAADRGYLKGIDGRKVYIRKDESGKIKKHTGLVMLIQSCEGIVMAFVYALLHRKIQDRGLDARLVIFNHDEVQAEVREDQVDEYTKLSEQCMKKAENFFKFRCPLEIEASVGEDWSVTH